MQEQNILIKKFRPIKNLGRREKLSFLVFPLAIMYMELIFKYLTTPVFLNWGLLFMPLYSLVAGTILNVICTSFGEKANRIIARIILFLLALLFSTQVVYFWCFDKYLILYSVGAGGADQIIEDGILEKTLQTIVACAIPVILLFVPAIAGLFLIGKRGVKFPKIHWRTRLITFGSSVATHFLIVLLVLAIPASNEVYTQAFDPNLTAAYFGLMNTELKDLTYNVLGLNHPSEIETDLVDLPTAVPPAEPKYEPWQMNIDFDTLKALETDEDILKLHNYFSTRQVTMKNKYTGMFKDYNLVYITAEGFSQYAIDKELTPTLYKMYNEGFRFNNFYTPIWGVSTSDGEYVNCTGLIPKAGVWSMYRSGEQKNNMYFTMGRQFLNAGVPKVYAYHPHTHTYYHRDISHPNMGYQYTGYGNGLENKITKSWPESDYEMIAATADEYISTDRFHAYYMSVSGHLDYAFNANAMSKKNKEAVKNLPYTDTIKAYIACNMELDKGMELLLKKLEEAGVADKTLIVISPDHYPYGLEDKNSDDKYHYFNEIAGHTIETNFELYKSVLLMYSPSMKEGIDVNKYCSSMDIIPTLSNLFDFEYDSRLLMGKDIFSDSEPLVVFSNRSFITGKGKYNAVTREFIPFDGVVIENQNQYLSKYKTEVNNMFLASAGILDHDYYGIVFGTKK